MRVHADEHTDTRTEANSFYNLSHAICYSYGSDITEGACNALSVEILSNAAQLYKNTFEKACST